MHGNSSIPVVVGNIYTGKVVRIADFGVFVEILPGVDGLVHISQLDTERVNKVEDVLRDGQEVQVWVRRIRKDRIELTMIEPLRYDWKDMQRDMVVKGKVFRLETSGAFVDIDAERPGMIHISELAHGYVKDANDVVKEGDEVEAKILSVDARKRQIRLSLKAMQPAMPEPEPEEREAKRGKRGKKTEQVEPQPEVVEDLEPQLTAMQLAWQAAQDRAQSKRKAGRAKRQRSSDSEQEEILSRTLEKRVPTGA